jgi:hypothetical protein
LDLDSPKDLGETKQMAARSRALGAPLTVLPTQTERAESLPSEARTGRIIDIDGPGRVLIQCDEAARPIVARHVTSITAQQMRHAVARKQSALVVFERGDAQRPIVIGLLAEEVAPEALETPATEDAAVGSPSAPEITARVDGKRVRISAEDEIVLECGESSITLRRNGRLIIRGAYVETRSRGTNRIKGGTVRIN